MHSSQTRSISVVQRAKNRLLPSGAATRTLPVGIGRGIRLEIDFRHDTQLYFGFYERELNRWLRVFCTPGAQCFDVGANMGYDALVMARLGAAHVLSFDCDPQVILRMRRNVASNPQFTTTIQVVESLVSNRSGHGEVALDDLVLSGQAHVPDFVKIDVEGAEGKVLDGLTRTMTDHKPHLIVETHSTALERQCLESLKEHGYAPVIVDQRRVLPENRPREHNRWLVAAGRA
jgi:Methyltransferase FkbM domain